MESGLNCGGHTFPTKGMLLGPIMEQFKQNREKLVSGLGAIYKRALKAMDKNPAEPELQVRFTAQGGIGDHDEHGMFLEYYGLDSTGWGTPFLLVPEATKIDPIHLERCSSATENDVYLSDSSPLGVPFWNLRTSGSEAKRMQRIKEGRPGSSCPKGFLSTNTELTGTPVCTASRLYQKKRLKSIEEGNFSAEQKDKLIQATLAKSCICHDLSGSIKLKHGIESKVDPAVCCGPNIAYFDNIVSLEEMLDHIYGRGVNLCTSERPHVFIRELRIYLEYLQIETELNSCGLSRHDSGYLSEFTANLRAGIEYYRELTQTLSLSNSALFTKELDKMILSLDRLVFAPV